MAVVAEALCGMAVAALFAAVVAIVSAEVLAARADRRYAEAVCDSGLRAEVRGIRLRADCERTRTLNDRAFEAAERECCRMPSREQVRADVSSVTGEHDRIGDVPEDERLMFALLVDGLRERPATVVDTDPGAAAASW